MCKIRIELSDEVCVLEPKHGTVRIYDEHGVLHGVVIAGVVPEQGADGGVYPVVKFELRESRSPEVEIVKKR